MQTEQGPGLAGSTGQADRRCCTTVLRHGLKQGLGHGKAGSKDPKFLPGLLKGAGKMKNNMCFDFHCVK